MHPYYITQQALYRMRKSFVEDFSFVDVRKDMEGLIFSHDECETLMELKENDKLVDKLLFLLIYKKKNVHDFIGKLWFKYEWLANGVNQRLDDNFWDSICDKYNDQIESLSGDVPKHFEMNVHRTEYVSFYILHQLNYKDLF